MNTKTVTVPLPNGILFISDRGGGSVPHPWRDVMIQATPSCIRVCGLHEQEGATEIIVGDSDVVGPRVEPSFIGALKTTGRTIVIWTVEDKIVLETIVPGEITQVRIWLSHPKWPGKVIVGVD